MKILLAVDGSAYTKKMLAYLCVHDELMGGGRNQCTLLTVMSALPARARRDERLDGNLKRRPLTDEFTGELDVGDAREDRVVEQAPFEDGLELDRVEPETGCAVDVVCHFYAPFGV